jgi:hypothetical protein
MKPVLLLAFLALGPALADPAPVVPAFYDSGTVVPVTAGPLHATDRVAAQAPLSADDRLRLCGS